MGTIYNSADIYDLIENEDRYQAYKKHWEYLFKDKKISFLLDVSIGSGHVTIPVTDLGISLSGSDLSKDMLRNCARKLEDKGITPDLKQADFRDLSCWDNRKYDVVASTGNSLAYVSNEDVIKTIEQMDLHVNDGGYLYIDSRNWDKVLKERSRFYLYDPFFVGDDRINFTQVWDYNADGSMTFNLLYTFEKNNKIYRKERFEEHYIPVSKELILNKIKELGYKDFKTYMFPAYAPFENIEDVDWYTILAKK